jgi:uncharacterized protein (DUF736 family)
VPAIGFVEKRTDGSYQGELKTLTVHSSLTLRPNLKKTEVSAPDFLVFANDLEIGGGWYKASAASGRQYLTVALAVPEFGGKPIRANLGPVVGTGGHHFALLWNPEA